MARQHAGEGAGQDQVTAIVLIAEDRAVALESARCGRLVNELELVADALARGFRPGEVAHAACSWCIARSSGSFDRGSALSKR
jgi:hypothetical protein